MNRKQEELTGIVGKENVVNDPNTLETFSQDNSYASPIKPRFVVKPRGVDDIQQLVKWANQSQTPLVPVSSGPPHFRGDTVPSVPEAVMVDLTGMNQIIRIDRRNRVAMIEPGVTYRQLKPELAKAGLDMPMPLLPRANKSVLTSLLEREPTMIPRCQWQALDPLRCVEVVWGDGVKLTTGEAGNWASFEGAWEKKLAPVSPAGPMQTDFYRFVSAAQGSMGIVTWASIRCEVLPALHKFFFVPSQGLDGLLDFAYRVLRFRFGDEVLLMNGQSLASIIGKGADQIKARAEELPQWVVLVGVAGRDALPKERVDYQEKDIRDIAQQYGLQLLPSIPGANGGLLKAKLRDTVESCWKLNYKGGCQDIFFMTTLNRTPDFVRTMYAVAEAHGYPTSEIGVYIQPMHQGASCHCEFSLPFDPDNTREVARVRELFTRASEVLLSQGAFYYRPYGIWADMAYNRDAQTSIVLKKIKDIFDPGNVMNPGKLCF